ncbi:putative ABC transport system permease protein [Chitinophaga skermanii]|uniref:Putative ABC transport system permease protein n=1 Tax=Chitinophaga skermanii TaxID=331697 RepID=A0A327Q293_9BACT|nr:ABC transporter permease [Chitinophaga skermanii]RAI97867.1 putative ABC transport system permease protein [Chitinophaga skermanii]
MLSTVKILWNSLKMALQELRMNKLRTFLSLLGITIGIFCIIAVRTATDSLETNIRNQLASLGTNVIFIQKWPWDGGPDFPWWKFVNRPEPRYQELKMVEDRAKTVEHAAFLSQVNNRRVEYGSDYIDNVNLLGVTYDFDKVQTVEIEQGRYFTPRESSDGANVVVLGADIWQQLFPPGTSIVGKYVNVAGHKCAVIGLLKYKGSGIIDASVYNDATVILPYMFLRKIVDERRYGDPWIMVIGKPGVTLNAMKDDMQGVMRAVRRLEPAEEDDFSLNEITAADKELNSIFTLLNTVGGVIAGFSLLVGCFGIANIMFVTVKERTNIIGLKKAIGAKRSIIMQEFLLESIILCLIGGLIGLVMIFGLTILVSLAGFTVTLTVKNIVVGLVFSVVMGIISGFIPAYSASKLDPVVAIRGN